MGKNLGKLTNKVAGEGKEKNSMQSCVIRLASRRGLGGTLFLRWCFQRRASQHLDDRMIGAKISKWE